MEIKLYNSLNKNVEIFKPIRENDVRMYSCGPTVYNNAHIGNMRAFLFADLLQRVLRVVGKYDVKWVMNITDIDDKTIRDSRPGSGAWLPAMGEQTEDAKENLRMLTEFYQDAFLEDISKLGIDVEHFYALPAATDFIDEMQTLILRIINNGYAYLSGGSVYFDVNKWRKDDHYGKLFKIDFDNFRAGARIDADEYERESVSDFVLWKEKKDGEPFWDFVIDGKNYQGRPGWHIECSAMEYELLELPFDIHTGGVDLKFPHHEDEIAQSKAGYGCEPTNFWLHNEFLEVEGEKMSKSACNFFTVKDLLNKGLDPIDIRFSMMSAHYRTKYNFTFSGVESTKKARKRIQEFIWELIDDSQISGTKNADTDKLRNDVFSELANDLHTPKALAHIFTFINSSVTVELSEESKLELVAFINELNHIFEAFTFEPKPKEDSSIPDNIIKMAQERWDAKQNRDFVTADTVRKSLDELGWIIKDAKDSYEIIKK
ncbi:MAG: cysteine--tRNA ligase [Candidatus Kapabacteria bacterium]|nr:cysteine--tRNA ligase [Ignavibacteriota bacterium]MCW5883525.1 cysteine--tRNA ligase [Candidatus Kapabacteria bacterium]